MLLAVYILIKLKEEEEEGTHAVCILVDFLITGGSLLILDGRKALCTDPFNEARQHIEILSSWNRGSVYTSTYTHIHTYTKRTAASLKSVTPILQTR